MRAVHLYISPSTRANALGTLRQYTCRSDAFTPRAVAQGRQTHWQTTGVGYSNGMKRPRSTWAPTPASGGQTITCRWQTGMSQSKDVASVPATSNKRMKKRQNIKRQVALTKREKMLISAKGTKDNATPADFPGEFAIAIKERFAPTVQSNVDSFRDYAKSLFKSDHPRAKRVGPKMDRKWWTVNIALALTPSVLIALYCEYERGPMEEYFKGIREKERKRIMGEFDVDEEAAEAALADLGIPLEEEGKKPFSERLADSASILYKSAVSFITGSDDEQEEQEIEMGQQIEEEPSADSAAAGIKHISSAPPPAEHEDVGDENVDKAPPAKTSVDEILRRIEALEKQVQLKTAQEEREKRRRAHQLKYQLERANQSGVQNRLEDTWINEWKKEREEQKRKLQEAQTSDGKQTVDLDLSLTGLIQENIRRKEEAVWEFGKSAIDAMKEVVLGGSDESKQVEDKGRSKNDNHKSSEDATSPMQNVHAVAAAVEKVAGSAQESAKSAQESVDALNNRDATAASRLAVKAAGEAEAAAKLAKDATKSLDVAVVCEDISQRHNGALRRFGGWVRTKMGGRSNRNNEKDGEDSNRSS